MMSDHDHRGSVTVRLLGAAQAWRDRLITEGFAVPTGGTRRVALADLRGVSDLSAAIADASALAGVEPLVAVIGLDDRLPPEPPIGVMLVRNAEGCESGIFRALRKAAASRIAAQTASTRYRALASSGHCFPNVKPEGLDTPIALLADPHPEVLHLLTATARRDLIAPLTSSQTLRLLEAQHAGGLLIHLAGGKEHRLPVLKLIRRQSDLKGLPVAVMAPEWSPEDAGPWISAGVDLLLTPDEVEHGLAFLRSAGNRFVAERTVSRALAASSMSDDGEASPIYGSVLFERLALEHLAQGDDLAFGAIRLTPDEHGTEHDLSEAGVYMAMAMSPLDFAMRVRDDLFIVAMPYADRFHAGRTMRTLKTLVEDLKFGTEPEPVLISARTAFLESTDESPAEAVARLVSVLDREPTSLALA
ncbi:hypothetical protein [Parvularcula lutaonensis]|uniref:GGDEF domain-containing protein n=1 Tax=Parvularcula lutaonensis TaxID=491923 RepID=A0ABV7MDY1_9PROT|nr:hypothetical protein [Parvularcula lutaonensis]GGY40861.1 hypothetical protein GCM10007148_06780 [Parvularcula lutaonensis]